MDFVSFKRAKFEFLPNLISWNVNFGRNCQDNHHEIAQFTKIWQTLLRNSLCCTSKVLVSKFSWSFTRFQQQNYIILEIWLLKLTIFPINFKVSASSNQKNWISRKKSWTYRSAGADRQNRIQFRKKRVSEQPLSKLWTCDGTCFVFFDSKTFVIVFCLLFFSCSRRRWNRNVMNYSKGRFQQLNWTLL